LAYLAPRRTAGAEEVTPQAYTRVTPGGSLTFEFDTPSGSLISPTEVPGTEDWNRLSALFRLHEDWTPPATFVADPLLGPLVRGVPGFRPLGCWSPFELCLRTIVGQQVSVAAAGTLMARLVARAGTWTPDAVARADLANLGMPGRRVQTIRALAEKAAAGDLSWASPWVELRESLARLPGFGPWTLDYLGIRLGRDLDALPTSDLGLLHATGSRTHKELVTRAEGWRPYRGWAASYLWMPASVRMD